MKIKNIKLKNFKGHIDTEIDFDDHLTVVVGINGAGKSSVLEAISLCLTWIIAKLKDPNAEGQYIPKNSVNNRVKKSENASISAQFDVIKSLIISNNSKNEAHNLSNFKDLKEYATGLKGLLDLEALEQVPVLMHYGVKRAVEDIPLRVRKNHIYSIFETYENYHSETANFKSFFEWYRNQEDVEKEKLRDNNFGVFDSNVSAYKFTADHELSAVRRAIQKFMPSYSHIRVKRNPLQMLVTKDGVTMSMEQLSEGEKIYFALVGDLCRRLVLANPTMEDPLLGEGIVLIDEIDLHLHPKWQKEIGVKLSQVFPNIQFIVTTHSPLIINNIHAESVRVIDDSSGEIEVTVPKYGFGIPSDIVMKDIMGLIAENDTITQLVDEIYYQLSEGKLEDVFELYHKIVQLSPALPELVRIRKLIERIERK